MGYFYNKKTVQSEQTPNRRKFAQSGIDVMILKIFSLIIFLCFLLKLLLFLQKLLITLDFEKNANFLPKIAKNRRKL
jgi:hypothetical protein